MSTENRAEPHAWELIADYWRYWRPFEQMYRFRPGVHPSTWPAIREPIPSITFDLKQPTKRIDDPEALFRQILLDAWSEPADRPLPIVALSWNHDGYLFHPDRQADLPASADWRVDAYPNGDYPIFATMDLRDGMFGHPWEATLCVFGAEFVGILGPRFGEHFRVLRSRVRRSP